MNTAETIVAIIGGSFTAMSVLKYMGVRHSVKALKATFSAAVPLLPDTLFNQHADEAVNVANDKVPGQRA